MFAKKKRWIGTNQIQSMWLIWFIGNALQTNNTEHKKHVYCNKTEFIDRRPLRFANALQVKVIATGVCFQNFSKFGIEICVQRTVYVFKFCL